MVKSEVDLGALYSGAGSAQTATGVRVTVAGRSTVLAENLSPTANSSLSLSTTRAAFDLWVRAGSSGRVALRGVRLWASVGGSLRELYPAGLLNEVHRLIASRGWRFALTGSSARKLRRGGANLLAGRARTLAMHP
ncbi:MAG: hypothetical protein JW940_37530 [Polyangiaceae bacterium]|nr:hypothetical protein [Polyangiaceae bacterium]